MLTNQIVCLPSIHTKAKLWACGGFWDPAKRRAQAPEELSNIASIYADFIARFAGTHPVFEEAATVGVGEQLQAKAEWLASQIANADTKFQTVIHGDYKTANIMFRGGAVKVDGSVGGDGSGGSGVAGVGKDATLPTAIIDFQWTGVGLGAQDVIYLLVTSAHHDVLGRADELLKFYHTSLCNHLADGGASYPYETFLRHYRLAALDYMRMLFAYPLKGATPETVRRDAGKYNLGLYRRSLENMAWLIRTAVKLLGEEGEKKKNFREITRYHVLHSDELGWSWDWPHP